MARGLGALLGAEGLLLRPPVDRLGAGPRLSRFRRARRGRRRRSAPRWTTSVTCSGSSTDSGGACGARRRRAASPSSATSRSTSRTTAPTSGRARISSSSTGPAGPRRSPAFRRTTSARPGSSGATRSTAGTSSRRRATPGGSRASAPCLRGLRSSPHRSLPRVRGLLVRAGDGEDRAGRPLGAGPGPRRSSTPRAPSSAPLPILAEDLGDIDDDVRALLAALGFPGHEDPAVRLLRARQSVPAAPVPEELRRLHRHARQRHGARLVRRAQARGARARLGLPRLRRARGRVVPDPRRLRLRRASARSSPCRTSSASAARRA